MDFDSANRYNWDISIDIQARPLWPYIRNPGVYKCPANRSYVTVNGKNVPRVRTMAMNLFVGGFAPPATRQHRARQRCERELGSRLYGLRAADGYLRRFFARPGQDFCFSGRAGRLRELGQFHDFDDGLLNQPKAYAYQEDLPGIYHNRACGFSFADGHSEIKKWLGWMPAMHYEDAYWENASFTLPNDPDIAWLQDHSTRPSASASAQ